MNTSHHGDSREPLAPGSSANTVDPAQCALIANGKLAEALQNHAPGAANWVGSDLVNALKEGLTHFPLATFTALKEAQALPFSLEPLGQAYRACLEDLRVPLGLRELADQKGSEHYAALAAVLPAQFEVFRTIPFGYSTTPTAQCLQQARVQVIGVYSALVALANGRLVAAHNSSNGIAEDVSLDRFLPDLSDTVRKHLDQRGITTIHGLQANLQILLGTFGEDEKSSGGMLGPRITFSRLSFGSELPPVIEISQNELVHFLFPREIPTDPASQIWIARVANDLYRESLARAGFFPKGSAIHPDGGQNAKASDADVMEMIREIPPPQLAEWLYKFFLEDLLASQERSDRTSYRSNDEYERTRAQRMIRDRGGFDRDR